MFHDGFHHANKSRSAGRGTGFKCFTFKDHQLLKSYSDGKGAKAAGGRCHLQLKTRDLGERPGPPPLYHQTLHSLADFAPGPADPVSACSAMSGHADNVVIHCPLNLRQRSQAERERYIKKKFRLD
ncbi:hypothetical protein PoB_002712400 [Plakobranchus ocellatus]|uniref:Uncharacterized protein n=1 Tax=Plakobranchus ocellatus TaxID=259542 RepID=A0AAV3ZZ51_9GAST|nr:hypothetical protein PoB_002712400 [Plakobranchus ocellatus]